MPPALPVSPGVLLLFGRQSLDGPIDRDASDLVLKDSVRATAIPRGEPQGEKHHDRRTTGRNQDGRQGGRSDGRPRTGTSARQPWQSFYRAELPDEKIGENVRLRLVFVKVARRGLRA